MNTSDALPVDWTVATEWRNGRTASPASAVKETESPMDAKGQVTAVNSKTDACRGGQEEGESEDAAVSIGLLRTCFSERYGSHIPRMFQDLLLDLGQAFAASVPNSGDTNGGDSIEGRGASAALTVKAPTFHVTEYDVIRGRYPPSWEDHAGYIIPGGVSSACGDEPWMLTLLDEVKSLRKTGRPVLGICLGHQVLAHGLGGLVQPRTADSGRHYALQESELLLSPSAAAGTIVDDAVKAVRNRAVPPPQVPPPQVPPPPPPPPPLKLLYHHNDEVVKLPPRASNIATSSRCGIHGMIMMATPAMSMGKIPSPSSAATRQLSPTPNLLSFQAHPELNYEYGRGVMDILLDGDVTFGRLTQVEATKLKEKVLAWDHNDFPVAIELMRRLFAPIVPRSHGGMSD